MARRSAIVIAAAFLTVLIVPAIPAAAGGGCHTGATQGKGDTVELVDACSDTHDPDDRPRRHGDLRERGSVRAQRHR